MSKPRLPPKKDVALALLQNTMLYLHLDPRHADVKVPPWFKRQAQLVLQIGLNMPVPIPDLMVDDAGISCTLSFSRTPHFCSIPWAAIYALVGDDGRGMVWPDDVPPEVAAQAQAQAQPARSAKRGHLRAVTAEAAAEAEAAEARVAAGAQQAAAPPKAEPELKPAVVLRPSAAKSSKKKDAAAAAPAPKRRGKSKKKEPAPALPKAEPVDDGRKAKRELPPYLRVVK
jgi:stringent starvation protein B